MGPQPKSRARPEVVFRCLLLVVPTGDKDSDRRYVRVLHFDVRVVCDDLVIPGSRDISGGGMLILLPTRLTPGRLIRCGYPAAR